MCDDPYAPPSRLGLPGFEAYVLSAGHATKVLTGEAGLVLIAVRDHGRELVAITPQQRRLAQARCSRKSMKVPPCQQDHGAEVEPKCRTRVTDETWSARRDGNALKRSLGG